MDEMPRQLIKEVREPIPPAPGRETRQNPHYQRNGVIPLFTLFEPLAWRHTVMTRKRRTAVDWAQCIDRLLTEHYSDAEQVLLVMNNLNTHKPKSLYEAFEPQKARQLASRLEIHYTLGTRKLAFRGRDRAERACQPVPVSPHSDRGRYAP